MPTAAAVIACALALLGKSEARMPRIVLVDVPPSTHRPRSKHTFVRTITTFMWSPRLPCSARFRVTGPNAVNHWR